MSERRRRHSLRATSQQDPIIEERRPEKSDSLVKPKRRTLVFQSTGLLRRRERTERSPSPVRYYARRPRAPSPPPRFNSPPLLDTMPPKTKDTSAPKFVPLPKPLPPKKEDKSRQDSKASDKAKDKDKERPKDRPTVEVKETTHRRNRSADTGYASGVSSPWSVEERSPLDYVYTPKSSGTGVDNERYEIITGTSRRRYPKYTGERKLGTPISAEPKKQVRYVSGDRPGDSEDSTEEKKELRYVIRSPDSPGHEDVYFPISEEPKKNRQAKVIQTTKILQEKLEKESETARYNYEAARKEEAQRLAQIEALQAELHKNRLERQIAEGRAAEAERKLKQQQIDDLEKELKLQQIEEQRTREDRVRREAALKEEQWREIQASPPRSTSTRRPTALIEQEAPKPRRPTVMVPYGSQTTVATQQPSILALDSPFLAPIFEAQRDEAARRAREANAERRSGNEVKETSRSIRQKPRRDDRYT